MLLTAAKLIFEVGDYRGRDRCDALQRTAWLLCGPLKPVAGLRRFLGVMGGLVFPAFTVVAAAGGDRGAAAAAASLALAASLGGEVCERLLFFRAVTRPKMPGGLPS